MARDLYTQLALSFQNPMIREETLEKIVNHLETKLEDFPIESEAINTAVASLKSRIKDYKQNDPAKNGYLRKLGLILAQSLSKSLTIEESDASIETVTKILSI